jgi:hypothetical protein
MAFREGMDMLMAADDELVPTADADDAVYMT